jgi:hypothetical protein
MNLPEFQGYKEREVWQYRFITAAFFSNNVIPYAE